MYEFTLLGWIALLPLLGAIFNGILGARLPRALVSTVAAGAMGVAFILSIVAVWTLFQGRFEGADGHTLYGALYHNVFTWFEVGSLRVDFELLLDPLSAVMILIITGVGFLIHVYSIGYMEGDRSWWRFFTYLNFFVFAMLMLVLGDNLVVLFLGWEGVGVASYLLIGFWYEDDEKASAGKKAFIVNRVGDFAVLLALFLLVIYAGSLSVVELREWASTLSPAQVTALGGVLTAICILLFIGCTGKSAQIPLFVWLPDAMAGPTPVSALIHAATMVTAGVYLIARLNFLFVLSPTAMTLIAVIGGLTAFFAATIGVVQNDIKKVLAYSTVSQLGFMFLAVGVGSFFAGVFHLMTHAFFKALLFLGAGSVIHGMHHEQDIRRMGGLKDYMPITRWTFLVGCLAIAGFPLFSGFFSKDEILWYTLANVHLLGGVNLSWFLWFLALGTAFLTAFYMFRLYFLTFEGECRADEKTRSHIHESPLAMTLPLVVLAVLAGFGGFVGIPPVLGNALGGLPNVMHDWLYQVIGPGEAFFAYRFEGYGMAWMSMAAATASGIGGIALAWLFYGKPSDVPGAMAEKAAAVHRILSNKYYVDEFYAATVGRGVTLLGRVCHRLVDELLIDTLLVNGTARLMGFLGSVLRVVQNGQVQRYVAFVFLGIAIILYLVLR
ncbi:MAG: NADH-quinone oxidoreductase subunit L [Deltaproteobacteria bacterium]|nr:MAG: NADH-quinone oxidoreductase subunit L [Deltaproteobacteria bacterium]